MKEKFKKAFLFILFFLLMFTFISCKQKKENNNFIFETDIKDEIYEEEEIVFNVFDKQNNITINFYNIECLDNSIIDCQIGKIKGLKVGNTTLEISFRYGKNDYSLSKNIKVLEKKEVKPFDFIIDCESNIISGKLYDLNIIDNDTLENIDDFNVFIDNDDILTYKEGKIKGLKNGSTKLIIIVTKDNKEYKHDIIINVTDKYIVTDLLNEYDGNTDVYVKVTLMPDNVVIDNFDVTSSDENVILYIEDDLIVTNKAGNAIVTISCKYQGFEYSTSVNVKVNEAKYLKIILDDEIYDNKDTSFTVYLMPDNVLISSFSATSTNRTCFDVDNNTIKPLKKGKGILSVVTSYNGKSVSGSLDIVVKKYLKPILITNLNSYMFLNEEVKVDAYFTNSLTDTCSISISNDVFSYDENKKTFKAVKTGSCEFTFSDGTNEEKQTVNVYEFEGIELEINPNIYTDELNEYKVKETHNNIYLNNFEYNVSDLLNINNKYIYPDPSSISDTDSKYILTISYKYNDVLYKKEAELNLIKREFNVERIIVEDSYACFENKEFTIFPNIYPLNSVSNIKFESLNPLICSVDDNGVVKGLKEGKCKIRCYDENNSSVCCSTIVTVLKDKGITENSNCIYKDSDLVSRYYEDSILNYYELLNGITETSMICYTSTETDRDVDGLNGLVETIEKDKYYSQHVHVLSVPSSTETKIVPWANLSNDGWKLTTVKGLIQNYEDNNPGYKVVAAINGDFFDINANRNMPYQTTGEHISDGEFYKTNNYFDPKGGTVGFTNDGSNVTLKASNNVQRTDKMIISLYNDDGIYKEFFVDKINTEPSSGETSIYYGTYNDDKEYCNIMPLGDNILLIKGFALANSYDDFYGKGVLSTFENKPIEKGEFALSTNNDELKEAIKTSKMIRVQYEYTGDFENVTSATGYNRVVYNSLDEVVNTSEDHLTIRAPRTVVGMKEDGTLIMMVVDGRQGAKDMFGCDVFELGAIMKAYGCVYAYNLDGGGSTTIVVKTETGLKVLNSPSDGHERSDGNCLLIVTKEPGFKTTVTDITDSSATINVECNNSEFDSYEKYVLLNNEYFKLEDGKAVINNLVHNSTYGYTVCYKKNDEMIKTQIVGSFTTWKNCYKYCGLLLDDEPDKYIFKVCYYDLDDASGLHEMKIIINGSSFYFNNGICEISKSYIDGDFIQELTIEYWCYENGNIVTKTIDNPDYLYHNSKPVSK